MKYIAILLFLTNVCYFAWTLSPYSAPVVIAERESVPTLNSGMTLLREYEEIRLQENIEAALRNKMCLEVSNLNNIDEANAFIEQAIVLGLEARLALLGGRLPSQYRVYLPSSSSRAVAALVLDSFSETAQNAGVEAESYLITRGVLENAVALGVFDSLDNALSIQSQAQSLGYNPEIQELPQSEGGISVRLESEITLGLDGEPWLTLANQWPRLNATENLCETIAQGETFP